MQKALTKVYAKCISSIMEEIFDIWPTVAAFAKDLGFPYPTVASWRHRGIPAKHDLEVIKAAERRGKVVTLLQLAKSRKELRNAA